MVIEITIVCVASISAQLIHYRFTRQENLAVETRALYEELKEDLKTVKEVKAKVEGLALRVGLGR